MNQYRSVGELIQIPIGVYIVFIMFVKFQGEIRQLTDYLHSLLLEGTDLSALYILEARLTILLHSLPTHRLLPLLFSPQQAKTILSTAALSLSPAKPHPCRESLSSQFSLGECSRLRFKVSEEVHSFRELSLFSCQILQSLQEWTSIVRKSRVIHKQIQLTESQNTMLNIVKNRQKEGSSFYSNNKIIHEAVTESPSSSSEESLLDQLEADEAADFLQYLARWSTQLQREILDFKIAIQPTKDDSSVDLTHDCRPSEALPPKQKSKVPSAGLGQGKKKPKIGSMNFECARRQKKAKKVREGCPQQCAIY